MLNISLKTILFVIGLGIVGVGGAVWVMNRPPSAKELIEHIQELQLLVEETSLIDVGVNQEYPYEIFESVPIGNVKVVFIAHVVINTSSQLSLLDEQAVEFTNNSATITLPSLVATAKFDEGKSEIVDSGTELSPVLKLATMTMLDEIATGISVGLDIVDAIGTELELLDEGLIEDVFLKEEIDMLQMKMISEKEALRVACDEGQLNFAQQRIENTFEEILNAEYNIEIVVEVSEVQGCIFAP